MMLARSRRTVQVYVRFVSYWGMFSGTWTEPNFWARSALFRVVCIHPRHTTHPPALVILCFVCVWCLGPSLDVVRPASLRVLVSILGMFMGPAVV